jgi:branched-chain amino acid aminotransferase
MAVTHFWVNDALIPIAEASVSVLDHGFTVADGVFETLKVIDGEAFAVDRHLARLEKSAAGLGIGLPVEDLIRKGISEVLASHSDLTLGRLRVTVTSGAGPLGSDRTNAVPTLVVSIAEQAAWPAETSVLVVPWIRNERSPLVDLKTTSYAENVYALEAAHANGFSEAILCDSHDHVSEGTGSNIFLVKDGSLITPSLESGLLQGITRNLVIEWAGLAGYEVVEREIAKHELLNASEVFITSSTRDVHPVTRMAELGSDGQLHSDRKLGSGLVSIALRELFISQRAMRMNP